MPNYVNLFNEYSLQNDLVTVYSDTKAIDTSEIRAGYYNEPSRGIVFCVNLNVGAGVESVAVGVQVSPDSISWYNAYVLDLSTTSWNSILTKTVTADTNAALLMLPYWATYFRFYATNSGANDATLSVDILLR